MFNFNSLATSVLELKTEFKRLTVNAHIGEHNYTDPLLCIHHISQPILQGVHYSISEKRTTYEILYHST